MATKLKILSLDGGGTRGIIPATILDCLFRETGKHPTDLFDLFAGTSTGGILSIGLTYGLPTAELIDLYQKKAKDIFYDSGWDDLRDGFGKNLGADYSNKHLKKILRETFGSATLKDIDAKYNGKKQLMVTSFDVNPPMTRAMPSISGRKSLTPGLFRIGMNHWLMWPFVLLQHQPTFLSIRKNTSMEVWR